MKSKPEVYEFERVVFGKKSVSFEAQYTIQEHARKHQNQFPAAAETVLESTYIEDLMDSTIYEQNAIDLYITALGEGRYACLKMAQQMYPRLERSSPRRSSQRRLLEWFGSWKLMCLHSTPNLPQLTFLRLKEMC